jgi:hypothetical protein
LRIDITFSYFLAKIVQNAISVKEKLRTKISHYREWTTISIAYGTTRLMRAHRALARAAEATGVHTLQIVIAGEGKALFK